LLGVAREGLSSALFRRQSRAVDVPSDELGSGRPGGDVSGVVCRRPASVGRRLSEVDTPRPTSRRCAMTAVPLFYTNSAEYPPAVREPCHDTAECKYGQQIKPEDRLPGHGNRFRCEECQKY
jgi:hypothetical protein